MRYFLILTMLYLHLTSFSDEKTEKTRRITFDAQSMEMDQSVAPDARRLIGQVTFEHEGVVMHCDSAYFYAERNALDAFSRVEVNRGDTLFLYCDQLFYDGQSRIVQARLHVRMVDDSTVLLTDSLDYDMSTDVGFYPAYGLIYSGLDTLTSVSGYYYAQKELMQFKDSVVLSSPGYRIYSDTLHYHTQDKQASFLGPTHLYGDSTYVYCEQGIFQTDTRIAELSVRTLLVRKTMQMKGDSLYYNDLEEYAEAFQHVELTDTTDYIWIYGHYGQVFLATREGFVTDSAMMLQLDQEDSLVMHADTLFYLRDSLDQRVLHAYYHLKLFNASFQAVADSAVYRESDSTILLFQDPVIWIEEQQMSADELTLFVKQGGIDSILMKRNAFIVDHEEDNYYNQIKGQEMMNYFQDNALKVIHVMRNAETVYYPRDEQKGVVEGMNQAASSEMYIFMKEGKVHSIRFDSQPKGTMYPLEEVPEDELFLRGFRWDEKDRPREVDDIFIWRESASEITD